MKRISRIILVAVAMLAMAMPAQAQFRWGIKAGMNISSLHFNESALDDIKDSENRTGFTGGLTFEFTVPVVGIGFDASVMYVRRGSELTFSKPELGAPAMALETAETKRDYIEIPVNLKWKLNLPLVGKIVAPYAFTGPSFAFLASKKDFVGAYKHKTFDAAWNVGGGLELFRFLQVGASYGWGMTKALEVVGVGNQPADLGKEKGWTVTAAILF